MFVGFEIKNAIPCYWCGEKKISMRNKYAKNYSFFVCCMNCENQSVRTKVFLSENYDGSKAIDAWNSGHVYIPLNVILPTLHYVTERKIWKNSGFENSEMTIKITKERGIADHLKYLLSIVLKPDGTINPYMFKLYQGFALHTGVQLLDIKDCGSYSMDFVFQSQDTHLSIISYQKRKTDSVWLKSRSIEPPINQKIFQMLGGGNDEKI